MQSAAPTDRIDLDGCGAARPGLLVLRERVQFRVRPTPSIDNVHRLSPSPPGQLGESAPTDPSFRRRVHVLFCSLLPTHYLRSSSRCFELNLVSPPSIRLRCFCTRTCRSPDAPLRAFRFARWRGATTTTCRATGRSRCPCPCRARSSSLSPGSSLRGAEAVAAASARLHLSRRRGRRCGCAAAWRPSLRRAPPSRKARPTRACPCPRAPSLRPSQSRKSKARPSQGPSAISICAAAGAAPGDRATLDRRRARRRGAAAAAAPGGPPSTRSCTPLCP